ncbi:hypothetical protein V6Z11_A07G253400 [Gossypium hirsutum]
MGEELEEDPRTCVLRRFRLFDLLYGYGGLMLMVPRFLGHVAQGDLKLCRLFGYARRRS